MSTLTTRPLEGIRVLDLTVALAGPYGALMLGGLGAEVIHIEPPGEGEIARTNPPFIGPRGPSLNAKADDEVSLTILNRGRNKKSVTLDLKSARGRELFFRLVETADVVIENMSEGTADRIGVGYEAVSRANPRIVYGSISAFGDPSIYPGLKGMDILVQAMSGLIEVTGFADGPPTRVGIPVADLVTPLYAVQGVLAALIQRGRTGEGQHVKVAMLDCMASLVAAEHFDIFHDAGQPMRSGNSADRLVPFGIFPCKDGNVGICGFRPEWMKGLLEAMGRPELLSDPRFASRGPRMQNAAELNKLIAGWTCTLTTAEVSSELFEKRQVPTVRVRSPKEVLSDPAMLERGAVTKLRHPVMGQAQAYGMGNPIQFSKANAQFDQPAQDLGQANEEIFGGLLKLSASEINQLRASRVI
jgi:crotonobetainyl-CoA:carnitine CoA-transferase CaiB-like acyl-CoA transferase